MRRLTLKASAGAVGIIKAVGTTRAIQGSATKGTKFPDCAAEDQFNYVELGDPLKANYALTVGSRYLFERLTERSYQQGCLVFYFVLAF